MLLRKWRPVDAFPEDDWKTVNHIVVPKKYRKEILGLAHDFPLGGHLGVRKSHGRILAHFYWPALKRDVMEYSKYSHVCQVVDKPNVKIPVAPLKPIIAFEEPFSRIIIAYDQPFKMYTDASDVGIGCVLTQEDCNGIDHPICYYSKKLNRHQNNYSTIEKECLAIILSG